MNTEQSTSANTYQASRQTISQYLADTRNAARDLSDAITKANQAGINVSVQANTDPDSAYLFQIVYHF